MTRRRMLLGGVAPFRPAAAAPRRPNIVMILADDLGGADAGAFGSNTIKTPNLDRLASQGVLLKSHYVCSPVCSPSRAGLLTGRYPQRSGVHGVLRDQHDGGGLSLEEETVADALSAAGYQTALIGKWHLGMAPGYRPRKRGFQYFYGFLNGTIDYHTHLSRGGGATGKRVTYRNETSVSETGYYPELLHREAARFIDESARAPFFLFFSLALPHTPLQVPDKWSAPYRHLSEPRATYAGMVACLDDGVGQVMAALERRGLADNTLVVFFSDHGWVKLPRQNVSEAGSNGEFTGGKYELTEGGLRSPAIVRWPGRIRPGTALDDPVTSLDWCATFREAAGVGARPGNRLDGDSLVAWLSRTRNLPERTLFWTFEDTLVKTPRSLAARRDKWKYLRIGDREALYDVASDPGEREDRSAAEPKVFKALRRQASDWQSRIL